MQMRGQGVKIMKQTKIMLGDTTKTQLRPTGSVQVGSVTELLFQRECFGPRFESRHVQGALGGRSVPSSDSARALGSMCGSRTVNSADFYGRSLLPRRIPPLPKELTLH